MTNESLAISLIVSVLGLQMGLNILMIRQYWSIPKLINETIEKLQKELTKIKIELGIK